MFDLKTWLVFVWAAAFAGIAALLEALLRHLRAGTTVTKQVMLVLAVETLVVAWWGGLAGWLINIAAPEIVARSPELLGVVAAVLGRGGLTFTRDAVMGLVKSLLKIDLDRRVGHQDPVDKRPE